MQIYLKNVFLDSRQKMKDLTISKKEIIEYSHKLKRELEKVCKVNKERAHGGCLGTNRR